MQSDNKGNVWSSARMVKTDKKGKRRKHETQLFSSSKEKGDGP